jgi:uncharacterized protein (TIGR03437 family)
MPVDLSPEDHGEISPDLHVALATDGKTWDRWRVKVGAGSCLSVWASGIPEDCEMKQVLVLLNGLNLPAIYVSEKPDDEGLRQVNATLPAGLPPGKVKLRLECAGNVSAPVDVELVK